MSGDGFGVLGSRDFGVRVLQLLGARGSGFLGLLDCGAGSRDWGAYGLEGSGRGFCSSWVQGFGVPSVWGLVALVASGSKRGSLLDCDYQVEL